MPAKAACSNPSRRCRSLGKLAAWPIRSWPLSSPQSPSTRSHAELAWDVDAWLATVLTPEARDAMELVRRVATADLPAFERTAAWLPEVGLQARAGLRRLRAEFVSRFSGLNRAGSRVDAG